MKRYVHPLKSFASTPNYVHLYCKPAVEYCEWTEVQALLRAVAGDVRTLNHQHNCSAQLCAKCGWRNGGPRHDDTLASSHGFEYHEFEVGACNCPRGKVLAMLEVEK